MPAARHRDEGSGGAERAAVPRRVQPVPGEHRVAVQPSLLAAAERMGAGHREKLREGAAGRRFRWASARGDCRFGRGILEAAQRTRPKESAAGGNVPAGNRRRDGHARGDVARIAFTMSTASAARTFIRTCDFCSAIIRSRRSSAAVRRCKSTSIFCSFIALDALDPIKTLSFLRHKILHVHSSNMYDNLPDEELVWRDNRLYWVHARAYIPAADAFRSLARRRSPASDLTKVIGRLLDIGPECLADRQRGLAFSAKRLESDAAGRAARGNRRAAGHFVSAGLTLPQMEDIPARGAQRSALSSELGGARQFPQHAAAVASAPDISRCRIFL